MRIHFVTTMILVALSVLCHGQDKHKVDSLEQILKTCDDRTKIDVLFELTRQIYENDYKQGLVYSERASRLVAQFDDSLQYVKIFSTYGLMLLLNGRNDESVKVLTAMERIARRRGFDQQYKKIVNYLGLYYVNNADFPQALRFHFKSLTLRENSNEKEGLSIALNNIGVVFTEADDHKKALEYFNKALKVKMDINDEYDLDKLLVNIGMCYTALHDAKKGRDFIAQGLNSCVGPCDKVIKMEGMRAYAWAFEHELKYDSAGRYYKDTYRLAKEVGAPRYEMYCLTGLGRVNRALGNSTVAMRYFLLADSIDKKCQQPSIVVEAYSELADYFFKTKDFERAGIYNQKHKVLQDTLYRRSLRMTVAIGEAEAEHREDLAKIESQNKIIELNEKIIVAQRKINVAAGIAGFLAVGFIGLLFLNIRQRKNTNALLETRVKERTRELESSYDSLRRASEDRDHTLKRAARELKDPLLSLQGINAVAQREVSHPKASDYFQRTDAIINQLFDVIDHFSLKD